MSSPSRLWWLSFSGEEGWRGAIQINADEYPELEDAIVRTHELGINPGGEILSYVVQLDDKMREHALEYGYERLISREDMGDDAMKVKATVDELGEVEDIVKI